MHIDPTTLRWYVAVATELHFGRAAAALGVARPRLSRAIVDLEAQLGYPLFDREAEGTVLTDAGRALLEAAPAALAEAEQRAAELAAEDAAPVPFRIAFVPGVTVTKWTREWEARHPQIPLEVVPVDAGDQTQVLREGIADVSFVRLPIAPEKLSVIPLYGEVAVVVVPKEHPLSLFDAVPLAEIAAEHLVQDPDEVPGWRDIAAEVREGRRSPQPAPATAEDALELVAAGVGIAVLPHSIARLHARKDVVARPVDGLPETRISVAWLAEETNDRIEEFIGIVRGRTAKSSRAATSAPDTGGRARSGAAAQPSGASGSGAGGGQAQRRKRTPAPGRPARPRKGRRR